MPDSFYKFHTNATVWKAAFKVCAAEDAHLVILNSAEEAKLTMDIFIEYAKSKPLGDFEKDRIMVGFNDLVTKGEHRTIDGKNNTLEIYSLIFVRFSHSSIF